MPARTCAQCGVTLPFPDRPGRPRTKCLDCSPPRARDTRRRKAKVVPLPTEVTTSDPDELMSLTEVAARIAARMASPDTPPSGLAALAREYRATLAEIEKSRPKAKDGIDEIAERRARRGAG